MIQNILVPTPWMAAKFSSGRYKLPPSFVRWWNIFTLLFPRFCLNRNTVWSWSNSDCLHLSSGAVWLNASNIRAFEVFNFTKSKEECKQSLLDHDQTVFLFRQNLGDSKVNIFHHLTKEGGNFYLPEENLGAIQGVGTGTTCIITPDIQTILALPVQQTQRVPSAKKLQSEDNVGC